MRILYPVGFTDVLFNDTGCHEQQFALQFIHIITQSRVGLVSEALDKFTPFDPVLIFPLY